MANYTNPAVLNAALAYIATANRMVVCAGEPSSYADVTTRKLGERTLIPGSGNGSFLIRDKDGGGREIVVSAQASIPVTAPGTANHLAFINTSTQTMIVVVMASAGKVVASGDLVNVASFVLHSYAS